mgnify:FL=1
MLRMKPGAVLGTPAPAGFRLLAATDRASRLVRVDLTLTCGTDSHGPDDPHTRGEAYDVRTRDLTASQAQRVLRAVLTDLCDEDGDQIVDTSGGFATAHFFGILEADHLHLQRRQGTVYASDARWA